MRACLVACCTTLVVGLVACGSDDAAGLGAPSPSVGDAQADADGVSESRDAGGSSSGGSGFTPDAAPPTDELGATVDGEASFYDVKAGTLGNCSVPAPDDFLVAALNPDDYAQSALCGGCVRVEGPDGEVTVRVWDQCASGCDRPSIEGRHGIDLSRTAFSAIASTSAGRVDVRWTPVRCPFPGNPEYLTFSDRIQVRNHKVPIAALSIESNGSFVPTTRRDDNYFVGRVPNGEFRVRVVASTGQTLEEILPGRDASTLGSQQFD